MSEPLVLNKYKDVIPSWSVYIGRPSLWGNPFIIGKDGSRDEVIEKYRVWIYNQPDLIKKSKMQLKGKNLVCFCSPLPCHGHILRDIANES